MFHRFAFANIAVNILFMISVKSESNQVCIPHDSENTTCTLTDVASGFDLDHSLSKMKENFGSIKQINFVDCFLEEIPIDIFTVYPNVEIVDAHYIGLVKFNLFQHKASKLRIINASMNNIDSIESQELLKAKNLESLDLSHNRISRMTPYTFQLNVKFKFLNLSHNQLKSLKLKVLEPLQSLETLHLENNQIKEISGNFKDFKPNWKELYLQNNMLKALDPSLVRTVLILNVTNNQISVAKFHDSKMIELHIKSNKLKNLVTGENLEKLVASYNHDVFDLDLKSSKGLKHLNLYHTSMKSKNEVLETILTLRQLTHLDLGEIGFSLRALMFKELRDLETLNLRGFLTDDNRIPHNTFNYLKKLKILDLTDNRVKEIDLANFGVLKSLEGIFFRYCRLNVIKDWQNITVHFPKIKKIDIYFNVLNCNEAKEMIESFKSKEIEIVDLKEYGEGKIIEYCTGKVPKTEDLSQDDDQDDQIDEDLNAEPEASESDQSNAGWIFLMIIILFVIGGLVLMLKKLDVFSMAQNKPEQLHNNELVSHEF